MPPSPLTRLLVVVLLAATAPAHAFGTLDRRFGQAGTVRLGFQAVAGESNDIAVVACSSSDALTVVGLASGGRRVVTARLDEGGGLIGKQSFDLPGEGAYDPVGTCLPEGRIALVLEATDAQDDGIVTLLRIDAQTGLPDPTFGQQGRVQVDLDTLQSPLGQFETPLFVGAGRNGELLVSGRYSLGSQNDRRAAFALRFAANGTLLAHAMTNRSDPGVTAYSAILPAADGSLWVSQARKLPDASYEAAVIRLDEATLGVIGTVQSPIGVDVYPGRAVMLDGGTFAFGGVRQDLKPVVVVVTAEDYSLLQLPVPDGVIGAAKPQVASLPDGALLLGGSLRGADAPAGLYFARVLRNPDRSLTLDTRFGNGGILAITHPRNPACPALATVQDFRRFTYWKGRPTAVGMLDLDCAANVDDGDYHVTRLALEGVHGDGFE